MSDSQITIFYSWQSDLPGNETRNIIQDSIKDVVRLLRDTVDIEADRDTKGEYGSPDIAKTIFSKIDNCDIFIADVTAVCKYEMTDKDGDVKNKYIPNPNVMLELGYATSIVGWENVICVLNSDYGNPEDMPFDIASRRLTPFSLKDGKSKGEVKRYIKGVIQDTVENILENGKRVKSGFSDLRLGCFVDCAVSNSVHPIEISNSVSFVKHRTQIVDECLKLVEIIRSIKITEPSELKSAEEEKHTDEENSSGTTAISKADGSVLTPVTTPLKFNLFKLHRVIIKDEDKEAIITLCKKYLDLDISQDTDFFNIGNLETQHNLLSYSYEGTEDEENKYDSINMLEYNLHRIQMLDCYVTTFDGLLLIPLVIENLSTVYDEAIDIHISVETDKVEVIKPSKYLLLPDMQGLESCIVEDDIIKELLLMPETSDISYDYDITNSIADTQAQIRARFNASSINGNPKYDADDYEREISKYIASPVDGSDSDFKFSISSLRAKERKWIGPAILLRAKEEKFDISYTIKSKHSDGTLSGKIKL